MDAQLCAPFERRLQAIDIGRKAEAFNNETLVYLQQSLWGRAAANVGVTLVACLVAGVAGFATARRLLG